LIVFDKRGTGLSDRLGPDEILSLEERMSDLERVMDAAGVEQAALFGISEGGAMAALMAATHPERVSKLILANSYARIDWAETDLIEQFLKRLERDWGSGNMIGRFLAPSWANDDDLRQLCARYERHSATPATAASYLRLSLHHLDVTDVLSAVRAPTLVLQREHDRMVPATSAITLAGRIPDADLRILPGADHLVFAGDTDDFLRPVQEFITATSPPTPSTELVLATVLFAVSAPSSEPASESIDARGNRQLAAFHNRAAGVIEQCEGRVISSGSDRFVATFTGPARAARAGLQLRDMIRTLDVDLRVGVHTAEIELRAGRIAGIGVDIGAHVADLAEVGEVWVSRTVRDLTAGSGLHFDGRGRHRVGGIDEEWELFAVTA
jgi:pimeloyl-ACP methyl ester carboxylesterase